MRPLTLLFSLLSLLSLLVNVAEAQDRIKGPDYMPWIKRTVDLTNHVPKSFRCSYKKRCKAEQERLTQMGKETVAKMREEGLIRGVGKMKEEGKAMMGHKVDAHKKEMEKKLVKLVSGK